MIYRRSLIQELVVTMLAVFIELLAITAVTQWVRYLGQAAAGVLAPEAVLTFLGFGTIGVLPVLLTVTLFTSVLLTLARMTRDNEMVVWQTAGMGITAWVRPVMALSSPIILFIAIISFVLAPWALRKSAEYREQLESREDISSISPGVFKESKQADRVYFVESLGTDHAMVKNIFVRSEQNGRFGIMVAKQGSQLLAHNGDRFIALDNGRRYEGLAGQADYRIMQFQRYTVRIEPYEVRLGAPSVRAVPTAELLRQSNRDKSAELQWRLSLPVSAILLVLLAIPLSYFNPRSGRAFHLVAALLIYMIYNNLLSIAQAWGQSGKVAPWAGVWSVHLVMLLLTVIFYYRRQSFASLWGWIRK